MTDDRAETEASSTGNVSERRRQLLKGAAAAGAVTWSAPAVLKMSSGAAAAGTVQGACYRYVYGFSCFSPSCGQAPGSSVSDPSNLQCCSGGWGSLTDAPAGLVSASPSAGCINSAQPAPFSVTFSTTNSDCYLVSPTVRFFDLDPSSSSTPCQQQTGSFSNDGSGGSDLFTSFRWDVGKDGEVKKFPYYFTFYVYCGAPADSEGPCTVFGGSSKLLA